MTVVQEKITAADVRAAMRTVYAQPNWALLFEVRDATGGRATRSADAIAMSLWPSRGLELHGFEIKVNRYDWTSELKRPAKAEVIAAYCDRWYVVATPNVVRDEEVPPAWGLKIWDGKRWTLRKEATLTEAKAADRLFMAALLRRVHKTDDAEIEALVAQKDQAREAAFRERVDDAVKWCTRDHETLAAAVKAFEEASGIEIAHSYSAGTDQTVWRPSIHMPRTASRLTLEVTERRSQKLQWLTDEDAVAEGIYPRQHAELGELWSFDVEGLAGVRDYTSVTVTPAGFSKPSHAFRRLWELLHGGNSWDRNPEVVALTFKVHKVNVDKMGAGA
jgi:hypothetical protein